MVPTRCGEVRNGIGLALSGRTLFIKICPRSVPAARRCPGFVAAGTPPVQIPEVFSSEVDAGSHEENASKQELKPRFDSIGMEKARVENNPPLPTGEATDFEGVEFRDQLLRRPSAVRFHCDTLSAIMRVDFIAAWLSWA